MVERCGDPTRLRVGGGAGVPPAPSVSAPVKPCNDLSFFDFWARTTHSWLRIGFGTHGLLLGYLVDDGPSATPDCGGLPGFHRVCPGLWRLQLALRLGWGPGRLLKAASPPPRRLSHPFAHFPLET